ncbi:hypothetical protein C8Q76DRAFT_224468 [Earliella scabrosa]|nr:hypothetical protein C8Q76DRAFT_224468 [Earliella scabrosa]
MHTREDTNGQVLRADGVDAESSLGPRASHKLIERRTSRSSTLSDEVRRFASRQEARMKSQLIRPTLQVPNIEKHRPPITSCSVNYAHNRTCTRLAAFVGHCADKNVNTTTTRPCLPFISDGWTYGASRT